MNGLVGGLFVVVTFVRVGFHLGLPSDVEQEIRRVPLETIAGLAGALIWGIYDVLRRFESVELSPVALHQVWLRMLVASVLAPILSKPFADPLKATVAFAVGAFPVKELLELVKGQARDRLKFSGSLQPAEQPTLHRLQGLSESMIERLLAEGFESAEHLATADPIKLLMRTNIEWKTILDLIDQAILLDYFPDNAELLRPCGIRGAIELATIQEDLDSEDNGARAQAQKLVLSIASVLKQDEACTRNAIRNAYEDVQVEFLWDLWGETADDDGEQTLMGPVSGGS